MPKRLLIVESPGKVKKLSQILGADWIVRASCGHIRELSAQGDDSLGFSMNGSHVQCDYVPRDQRAKETIGQLKAAAKGVDEVVLATDPDREGETIAWHLAQVLGLKDPKRVVYTEITASAVLNAIAKSRKLDFNLVGHFQKIKCPAVSIIFLAQPIYLGAFALKAKATAGHFICWISLGAGLCRDCLDKLVGYKGSPLVWALNNGAKSVGRVQSATLHLICQREREIQNFVPQDYWNVWVDYAEGFRAFYNGTTKGSQNTPQQEAETNDDAAFNKEQVTESKRVLSETEAARLVQEARQYPHQIVQIEGKTVYRQPPPPFTTSTLQQAAGSKLRFSPDKTMLLAQKLYEAGLITYMRTDSVMLSPEFCASARRWLEQNDPSNVPQQLAKHRSSKVDGRYYTQIARTLFLTIEIILNLRR